MSTSERFFIDKVKLGLLVAATSLLAAGCATSGGESADMPTAAYGVEVQDVEALNDRINDLQGQKVTVPGEVQNKGPYSFVLESGGIINDEILVIPSDNVDMQQFAKFTEDNNVTVVGTVRTATIIDIEQEYGWDLDPEIEAEIEGVAGFIVADQIVPQPD